MNFQDYKNAVLEDAKDAIEMGDYDYIHKDNLSIDCLTEDMWTDDSITGNGSGSYTFNSAVALENIKDLIWDEEFQEELHSTGYKLGELIEDRFPEEIDVIARCMALVSVAYEIEDLFIAHAESLDAELLSDAS